VAATFKKVMPLGKIQARIKTAFGEIVVEEEGAEELLQTLRTLPVNFVDDVESIVTVKTYPASREPFDGIIEFAKEGPILTSSAKLTHYEAIGLILYASDERTNSATQISRLLERSGTKPRVSSRLNEMAKRGLIYKPDPVEAGWRMTAQGEKWIQEIVLPKTGRASEK